MERKLVVLLLISITALLHTAAAMPPSQLVNCCTRVLNKFDTKMLKRVKSFQMQHDRFCAIKAVLLHIARHRICIDPNNAHLQRWMKKHQNKKQNNI
ncbi:C-C motif chemokine 28-like [Hemiscyllium ocellatum]|uniref:C-C motif chemokine 28-like n=1 Tax=Hemiscyllium ocellatum TaxID=170820 RepID=UPI0029665112|nr:C-C motif chemokine 28-like [Hemiscyllium ocellatum]